MPPQPALPSGTAVVASGTLTFTLAPGATRRFEPADLAASRGASPAPSTSFTWTIAWRASEPLVSAWYRQTDRIEIGRGRWGTADLGGSAFELKNDGTATVFGELAYTIGTR